MARVGGKARGRMLPCKRVRFLQKGRTKVAHGPSGDLDAAWWPGTAARGRGPFQGVSLQGSPGRNWARGSLTSPLHHPHPGGYRSAATPRCSRKTPRLQHLHGDAARLRLGSVGFPRFRPESESASKSHASQNVRKGRRSVGAAACPCS
ncbi:uncharacterized protein LOC117062490 isoform X3 [Trachypithecus francoisi]|uniref:uncharacterized protein LOC117062490 isoform X3 n=1 Tax=Trachypithecus francoisi TaxID=54180 RepID=UPI00141BCB32|nr:uncharacterized protein LOC117062490 isoform X3 [Trachypithecus francoisi]